MQSESQKWSNKRSGWAEGTTNNQNKAELVKPADPVEQVVLLNLLELLNLCTR